MSEVEYPLAMDIKTIVANNPFLQSFSSGQERDLVGWNLNFCAKENNSLL